MKNLSLITFIIVVLSMPFWFTVEDKPQPVKKVFTLELGAEIKKEPTKLVLPEELVVKKEIRTFEMFIDSLAFKESSNRYDIVNRYGYKGRYQIGGSAMKDLGIYGRKDFLQNHRLQDKAFLSLLQINKYRLRKEIKKYVGKTVDGVLITESGLLSAAHLVGSTAVKRFLKKNKITRDGNGVSVKHYIKKFSGYEITIEAKRKINLSNYK